MYSSSFESDTGAAFLAKTRDRGIGLCGPKTRDDCTRVTVEEESRGALWAEDVEASEAVSARYNVSRWYFDLGYSVVDVYDEPGSSDCSSMAVSSSVAAPAGSTQPEVRDRELPDGNALR